MSCYFPCQKFPPPIASMRKIEAIKKEKPRVAHFSFSACHVTNVCASPTCVAGGGLLFFPLIEPPGFSILLCVGSAFPGKMDDSRGVGCVHFSI